MNVCVECGPTDRRIQARGVCCNCYMREYNRAKKRDRSKEPTRRYPKLPAEPLATLFESKAWTLHKDRRNHLKQSIESWVKQGTVGAHQIDRICVNDFGIHPAELYGREWWTA